MDTKKLFETPDTEPIVGNVVLGVEFQQKRKRWMDIRAKKPSGNQKSIKIRLSPTFPAIPTQKEK